MADTQRSIDPQNPTDTPLADVVDELGGEGLDGQFRSEERARIRCLTCQHLFDAVTVDADQVTRLEGASDPADMTMVVPVSCPVCGTSGALVLGFGPAASAEDGDVVRAVSRHPATGGPGGADQAAPGIPDDPSS